MVSFIATAANIYCATFKNPGPLLELRGPWRVDQSCHDIVIILIVAATFLLDDDLSRGLLQILG